ncbi:MAG: MBL fold metallo-hydrolase [Candidatus Thorarchaeota archaeon]
MIEIEPYDKNITCIKTATPMDDGKPIMWAYAYHILDSLIDAGCPNANDELAKYNAKKPAKNVYLTHAHEDHTGGATVFAKTASVYAWGSSINLVKRPPEIPEFFQFVWGQPTPLDNVQILPRNFEIGDFTFEVVDLPGHFADMVGFLEPERKWLFSADAVPLPSRKFLAMPEENIPRMITTMEYIQTMGVEILFDGHRGPVMSPYDYIQKRIDYLKEMIVKVRDLHEEGLNQQQMMDRLELTPPWYVGMTQERFAVEHFIRSIINDSP